MAEQGDIENKKNLEQREESPEFEIDDSEAALFAHDYIQQYEQAIRNTPEFIQALQDRDDGVTADNFFAQESEEVDFVKGDYTYYVFSNNTHAFNKKLKHNWSQRDLLIKKGPVNPIKGDVQTHELLSLKANQVVENGEFYGGMLFHRAEKSDGLKYYAKEPGRINDLAMKGRVEGFLTNFGKPPPLGTQ